MRIFFRIEFLVAYLVGCFCIYGLPDGFYRIDWVTDFSSFMRNAIPSIDGYWSKSNFPELSVFYLSIQPLIFLPAFVRMLRDRDICFNKGGMNEVYIFIKNKKYPSITALLGVGLFLFSAFIFYAQPGYQFGLMPVNEKRWALAIFGPIVGFFSVYLMLSLAWHYFFMFRKFLRG